MRQISHLRWWIAALLALATALNYLDRQNLPVVIGEIQRTIPVSDAAYARLQMLFLFAYGAMYAGGGRIVDLLGTRLGYAVMIVWWSAANFMHGMVSGVAGLGVARLLLGLGEGGGFPASAKAVSEWFPAKDRSLAFGIFNTGSSLGAVLAPPLIAGIVLHSNWRWVFFITGALGWLWALGWWFYYDSPGRHRRISSEERSYLQQSLVGDTEPGRDTVSRVRWLDLFRYRQVWGLLAAKFLSDSAWYFFIFWLPKYLGDVRHLNIKEIGYYAWIPYAFAGAGSLLGGWLSSHLMRRNLGIDLSRKIALGVSAALMPVSLLIAASPLSLAIVFFGLAMFGHQWWSTIAQTLAADLFPPSAVGSVAGLMGAVGSFGGMLFNYTAGLILTQTHSYSSLFIVSGLLHPAAFLLVLLMIRKIGPVTIPAEDAKGKC